MPRKPAATPANSFSFGNVVEVSPTKKKSDRAQIQCGEVVEEIAALKVVLAMVTVALEDRKTDLKDGPMTTYFVETGRQLGKQPENVDGVHNLHTASLQLRKRSSRSPLSTEEVELCSQYGIPTETTQPKLTFNSDYLPGGKKHDPALMAKIEKALQSIADLPGDIIVREGSATTVTTTDSIDAIFKNKKLGEKEVRQLLPVVGSLGVGGKYHMVGGNVQPALEVAARVMQMPALKEKLNAAAADPDKVLNPYKKAA